MYAYKQGIEQRDIKPIRTLVEEGWRILDGAPVQSLRLDHGSIANGPVVGIWKCTPAIIEKEVQPANEFVTIYEGALAAAINDGPIVELAPGDSFFLPKGVKIRWEIRETAAKYLIVCGAGPLY